jgi:hypothetical protein
MELRHAVNRQVGTPARSPRFAGIARRFQVCAESEKVFSFWRKR